MYKILFTKKAEKELNKLAKNDAREIIKKIQKLDFPFPASLDIKKLTGSKDFYRLRVKRMRVILEINHSAKQIWIRRVGYRRDVYRFFGF